MTEHPTYLLDTSIQIKRLISLKWRAGGLDAAWKDVKPIASMYSFMEFKNSVIRALKYLVSILREMESAKG